MRGSSVLTISLHWQIEKLKINNLLFRKCAFKLKNWPQNLLDKPGSTHEQNERKLNKLS